MVARLDVPSCCLANLCPPPATRGYGGRVSGGDFDGAFLWDSEEDPFRSRHGRSKEGVVGWKVA